VKGACIVVLDACVLIPMPLADTLLRLAAGPHLYVPKWSDRIMGEVNRTLCEDFGLSPEKALHRDSEIRRHFPAAWIEGYESLIPSMTNHPKDRHVLAAAVHAHATAIITYNRRDFPPTSLTPHAITAMGPSTFLRDLYAGAPAQVVATLEAQAAAIRQPLSYVLSRLRVNVPAFVEMIEKATRNE
jgi:hypothetical protein